MATKNFQSQLNLHYHFSLQYSTQKDEYIPYLFLIEKT